MATPADHYAKAEAILDDVRERLTEVAEHGPIVAIDMALVSATIQAAQVHATLAAVDPTRWPQAHVDQLGLRVITNPLQPKGSSGEVRMEGTD